MRLKPSALIVSLLLVSSTLAFGLSVISVPAAAGTAPTELFISEYIEGGSFNKAIEIYNGTGAAVDLSDYQLELYSNGSQTVSASQILSGTLADGDVWVICHKKANAAILAVADFVEDTTRAINFNGDDGIVLRKISTGSVVDAIGQHGVRVNWPGGGKDHTQVRKLKTQGDTNFEDAFTFADEWDTYPKDTVTYLGWHIWEELAPLEVTVNLDPDTLNLKSGGKWITAYVEVTGNGYDATNIDQCSLVLVTPVMETIEVQKTIKIYPTEDTNVMEGFPDDARDPLLYNFYVGWDVTVMAEDGGSVPTDLFISEYIEGSGYYNKAIEIYNGTGAPVDLSDYQLELYVNGKIPPEDPPKIFVLSGTLDSGDVCVVGREKADPAILAVIDLYSATLCNFNGDDGIVLRKISTGSVVDAIGQLGVDPGTEWPGGGKDDTMVRNLETQGDTNFEDAFTFADEWDRYAINTFTYLGSHVWEEPAGPAGYLSERAYLKFDLSAVGDLDSAVLNIYNKYAPSTGIPDYIGKTIVVDAKEVEDDSWYESDLTWNNAPDMGSVLGSVTVDAGGQWWSFDVETYIASELAGDGTASIGLMSQNEGTDDAVVWFYAKDAEEGQPRVHLEITHTIEVEVPITVDHEDDDKYGFVSDPQIIDRDESGVDELMVKFDRQALIAALDGLEGTDVDLYVTGAINGESFESAIDTIRVIKPGKPK